MKDVYTKYKTIQCITYSVDRVDPYELSKGHKIISRYLQGYEVILLSIMGYFVLYTSGLILYNDHDGLLCIYRKSTHINNKEFTQIIINRRTCLM